MPFSIKEKSEFIEVAMEGYITGEILKLALKQVMSLPDYPHKNTVYDYRNAIIGLSGFEFPEIIEYVELLYPQKTTRSKTAIIVSSGLQRGIMETYKDVGKNLPFEIDVFWDKGSAEKWVTEEKTS
jgi:hypothetical protein